MPAAFTEALLQNFSLLLRQIQRLQRFRSHIPVSLSQSGVLNSSVSGPVMCAQLDAQSGEAQRCAEDEGMETRGAAAAHWQLGEPVSVCVCVSVYVCVCVCVWRFYYCQQRYVIRPFPPAGPSPKHSSKNQSIKGTFWRMITNTKLLTVTGKWSGINQINW